VLGGSGASSLAAGLQWGNDAPADGRYYANSLLLDSASRAT